MNRLVPFYLSAADRDGFGQKQICMTCGTNAGVGPKRKKFQWAPRWVSYLVLLSPLIYIIVYLVKSKKATLEVPQCAECEKKEKSYKVAGLILVFGGILFVFASMLFLSMDRLSYLFGLGFVVFLVSLIVGVVLLAVSAIRVEQIDDGGAITFMLKEDVVTKLKS